MSVFFTEGRSETFSAVCATPLKDVYGHIFKDFCGNMMFCRRIFGPYIDKKIAEKKLERHFCVDHGNAGFFGQAETIGYVNHSDIINRLEINDIFYRIYWKSQ